jgi:3'(2'), 5'-bisphosphate nucleotidase
MKIDVRSCLDIAIPAALEAGRAIVAVYENENAACTVELKSDNSPLTYADKASHDVIMRFLNETPYPVLSEEGRTVPYAERREWNPLWIVDPLDGTKEFIKRNGEFTVNIALVQDAVPVCGVIFVPVTRHLYFGAQDLGSFRIEMTGEYPGFDAVLASSTRLPQPDDRTRFVIMGSRSHGSPALEEFVAKARIENAQVELAPAGSSLKICRVAEGSADVYPRLGPTMEWDTAAGHAIAKFAGKGLTDWETGAELTYNKENLLNSWFVVR